MLCLRALYFVIEFLADTFCLLKYGLALILLYVGIRLIMEAFVEIPEIISMIIIMACFLGSILASHLQTVYFRVRTRSNSVELPEVDHPNDHREKSQPPSSQIELSSLPCCDLAPSVEKQEYY